MPEQKKPMPEQGKPMSEQGKTKLPEPYILEDVILCNHLLGYWFRHTCQKRLFRFSEEKQ